MGAPEVCDLGGGADGVDEAGGIGQVAADDVVGGAVGDAGADDGQAECDVDGVSEGAGFDGDVALVVVDRDHGVEAAVEGGFEEGIGGDGADRVEAESVGPVDGWGDELRFLESEEAVFAGVGIETGDADARRGICGEGAKALIGQADRGEDAGWGQEVEDLAERDVEGDVDDAEAGRSGGNRVGDVEHHGMFGAAAEAGEDFGVSGLGNTGGMESFLV